MTRAANRAVTLSAFRKTAMAPASMSSATASTGRRPRKSESRPTVSRLSSRASTYTAKIAVKVRALKPNSAWYTG
jgi:hypothetical protein